MTGVATLVTKVVENHHRDKGMLIQILLDLQSSLGWLPQEALAQVSQQLRVPVTRIYQVASYYKAFSFAPKGRHSIKVCLGTACHVKGGEQILDVIERRLEVTPGEATADGRYQLERVACLGCCALAPVLAIDDKIYGETSVLRVHEMLEERGNREDA